MRNRQQSTEWRWRRILRARRSLVVIPIAALLLAEAVHAGPDRRGRAADRVSAQEYRSAGERRANRAKAAAPAKNSRRAERPKAERKSSSQRSGQSRSQRKGESDMAGSSRSGRSEQRAGGNERSRKQAAVQRYKRRVDQGGANRPHQTSSGRANAARSGRSEPRQAQRAVSSRPESRRERTERPQTQRSNGNRDRRRGSGRTSTDAMAYAPSRSEQRSEQRSDDRRGQGRDLRRGDGRRGDGRHGEGRHRDGRHGNGKGYKEGYRKGVRDAHRDRRRDQRRYHKRRHFLDHWRPYPGWVAPLRIYRDTVWVGFSTHHHKAHRHGYLSDLWLFAGEFKTRTRHVSDPVIYVDDRVDAIEIEGLKRDLHVRKAWMILGNGRPVRLHDLEGYIDAGYSRAVFLSRDRYVKRIELEVEPVGYSRGYARINVRRTDSGHIHDDYCEH